MNLFEWEEFLILETSARSQCGENFGEDQVFIGSKMKELFDFDQYLNESSFPPKKVFNLVL